MEIQVERRLKPSRVSNLTIPPIAVLIALLIGAQIILIAGANPTATYTAILKGACGNLAEVVVKAIPLILCGLAVALATRAGFWNIGAEGQLALGGIGAAGVALFLPDSWPTIPGWLLILLMLVGGAISGALWGILPAIPKMCIGVNEILTTLFANYIAIRLVQYLYYGPWRDPEGRGFPGTALFVREAWFPRMGTTRIHLGLVFALILPPLIWFLLSFTKLGYQIKVVGESTETARYAGINISRVTTLAVLISAGIAGLVGTCEVGGILHRLHQGLTVGYGYTGLIVAWLANLNPWGVMVIAFLLAGLLVGGDQVQMSMGLPASVGLVIQGLILICVLGSRFLTEYRISWR